MLKFYAGAFAIAGLVAAAAPILIHLLNRRRFRLVPWAAMDFLRLAMQRSRKVLQLRDLLLLIVRVLAVVLFGLALARPFLAQGSDGSWLNLAWIVGAVLAAFAAGLWATLSSQPGARKLGGVMALGAACLAGWGIFTLSKSHRESDEGLASSQEPVHAILVVDNSLSMAQLELNRTVLDLAKSRAAELVDRLPRGSRISVIPACGPRSQFSSEPYRTRQDALEAIAAIKLVDRRAGVPQVAALAMEAQQAAPDLPAKRVVLFGDQQQIDWSRATVSALAELQDVQVVQLAPPETSGGNAWVADLRLRDGVADVESSSTILVTVAYEGAEPRRDVQVTLAADGVTVASQTIDLQPGQRQVLEFSHKFDVPLEPGRPSYSLVAASLSHDQLPEDDYRPLVAPVLAALPVVFIDQYGEQGEDPRRNQIGETFAFRRLLAPVTSHDSSDRELVFVRHGTIDQLARSSSGADSGFTMPLDDARLVVVAGVQRPTPEAVELLREYVIQGGQLVIAAGADFDPIAWHEVAWQDGAGILPLPLADKTVGGLPREGGQVVPFQLDMNSVQQSPYFQVENESATALEDLYRSVLFFKAVNVADDADTFSGLLQRSIARHEQQQAFLAEEAVRARHEAQGQLTPAEAAQRQADFEKLQQVQPEWLLWAERVGRPEISAEDAASSEQPRVRARFVGGAPYMVERNLGRGRVVLVASGVYTGHDWSGWNTLSNTSAMLVFDRLLRGMIESTLPPRNVATSDQVQFPVEPGLRRNRFALVRPGWNTADDPLTATMPSAIPNEAAVPPGSEDRGGPAAEGESQGAEGSLAGKLPTAAPRAIEEPLSVDALGAERYGLTLRDLTRRGFYRVVARRPESAAYEGLDVNVWEVALAATGPEEESALARIDRAGFNQLLADEPGLVQKVRWVGVGETIRVEGARAIGQPWWWKVLLVGVLVCLGMEMLVLAWSRRLGPATTSATASTRLSGNLAGSKLAANSPAGFGQPGNPATGPTSAAPQEVGT